eukprot:1821907-Prymnesium_polylepis.1
MASTRRSWSRATSCRCLRVCARASRSRLPRCRACCLTYSMLTCECAQPPSRSWESITLCRICTF